jgi:asparagine synthase (glutamine-hydrolysing)
VCGIAAIVAREGERVDPRDLARMVSTLRHRGPDGAGRAVAHDGRVGLGHARLALVDAVGGAQPMGDDAGRWVSFNGEIYNHDALRRELAGQGHRFGTRSDTEVLLAAWATWGAACLSRLDGEFAFVLWDGPARALFAARDAGGVKPLFYRHAPDGELLLASEAKAMLALPRVPRALSKDYLCGPFLGVYAGTGPDDTDATCAFEGITCLVPGGWLRWEQGVVTTGRWARAGDLGATRPLRQAVSAALSPGRVPASFVESRDAVRAALERAVVQRVAGETPVHVFLSGGVDSAAVLGLARACAPDARMRAYTVAFDDELLDESAAAARIAAHNGVPLAVHRVGDADLGAGLVAAVRHTESAFGNPNTMARMALAGRVRADGGRAVLTGEGADELFGGYAYFKLVALWRMGRAGGDAARTGRERYLEFRQQEAASMGLSWYPGLPWRGPQHLGEPHFNALRAQATAGVHRWVLAGDRLGLRPDDDPWERFQRSYPPGRYAGMDPFQVSCALAMPQLTGYLLPVLGDRVEMAHGVEGRTPFLDRAVMDVARAVPPSHHLDLDTLTEKALLRAAVRDVLPPQAAAARKHPFLAPSWRRVAATPAGRDAFATWLSPRAVASAGVLAPWTMRALQAVWPMTSPGSREGRRLDLLLGLCLTVQILHGECVARAPESDPDFPLEDMCASRAARATA